MEIALALGGGGSKGHAHIGILRVLEREGVHVRAIAGTSMGGVIGAGIAAGYGPDWIETFIDALVRDTPFARGRDEGPALMGLTRVSAALTEALGDLTFAELRIPFAVTAVDLDTAELVALREGLVREAVLATIAIPGAFPVKERNGRSLIDGATLDPVPVSLARSLAPELPVVAVALSPPRDRWIRRAKPRLLISPPFLGKYLARFRWAQAANIFLGAVDISVAHLTELRLSLDHPDAIIRPDVHHIGSLDPVDVHEVALLGERAAEEALPGILQLAHAPSSLARRLRRGRKPGEPDRYVT